jgi:hypothetical protein
MVKNTIRLFATPGIPIGDEEMSEHEALAMIRGHYGPWKQNRVIPWRRAAKRE